jgi:hypothetical protein
MATHDALLVLIHPLIPFAPHAARGQGSNRGIDVVDWDVEDGVGGGGVVRCGIDEDVTAAGEMQRQQAMLLGGSARP